MAPIFEVKTLSGNAIEVLEQLFVKGPTWDGNLVSKSGRDELVGIGLAGRVNGWQFLTEAGVRLATEWNPAELRARHYQGWYNKAHRQA